MTAVQITDVVVSKDPPPYIADLPRRVGGRPRIARQYPCLQLTGADDPAVQGLIIERVRGWPGIEVAAPRQTIPGCRALVLDAELAHGQGEAFILGREFAHLRADGSVHVALAPEWAEEVLRRGWGQLHPLALYGLIQPQSLVLYAPRSPEELDVVVALVQAAYAYACGHEVTGTP
ncbi:MAG: luciferase family protein [Solirubrobacteraceae bacterium]